MDLNSFSERESVLGKIDSPHRSLYLVMSELKNQSLKSDGKAASNNQDEDFGWVDIEEKSLSQLILETFVNPQKKKILNLTSDRVLTAPEILEICKMPTTSGYRTINSLIKNGLLVKSPDGYIKYGRRINKYKSVFKDVKINIEKNKISVNAKFAV